MTSLPPSLPPSLPDEWAVRLTDAGWWAVFRHNGFIIDLGVWRDLADARAAVRDYVRPRVADHFAPLGRDGMEQEKE